MKENDGKDFAVAGILSSVKTEKYRTIYFTTS